VSYAVGRQSTDGVFRRWSVELGEWVADQPIDGMLAPHWDPMTGRVELAIPVWALSSGVVEPGQSWAAIVVALAQQDPNGDTWVDGDRILLHYRFSTPDQSWIYGDIEL